jgi:hypothetical protein
VNKIFRAGHGFSTIQTASRDPDNAEKWVQFAGIQTVSRDTRNGSKLNDTKTSFFANFTCLHDVT